MSFLVEMMESFTREYLKKNKKENTFLLHSDNSVYKPFELKASDLLEIWEHVCSFCTKEFQPDDLGVMNVKDMFHQLRIELSEVKSKVQELS